MRIPLYVLAVSIFWFCEVASANNTATVEQFLNGFTSLSEKKCQNRGSLEKEYEAQGKINEARSVKLAEQSICECMPNQVKNLRTTLSKDKLQQRMTESEFMIHYSAQIINKCAGAQFRAIYGEGCTEQFSKLHKNPAAYCECMHSSLAQISDAEVAQIGKESSEYMPLAARAKSEGNPAPEKPEGIKRIESIHAVCISK